MRNRILEATDRQFHDNGFAATGVASIAKLAGVSTRTLYRLFRNKADLLSGVLVRRIDQFLDTLQTDLSPDLPPRDGLIRILVAYGKLTLSPDGIRVAKLVFEESGAHPEIAAIFHQRAIVPTNTALEKWLTTCLDRGLRTLKYPSETSGMLRGMMIMEPQRRAVLGCGQPLSDAAIRARAEMCADWFLDGVQVFHSRDHSK
jgi:AcrR family transcriptional regulator